VEFLATVIPFFHEKAKLLHLSAYRIVARAF